MTERLAYDGVKRGCDLALALVGIVLSAPIQAVVAVLVAVNLGRPVIFAQPRPGLGGKVFMLYKFRTMKPIDAANNVVADDERLTKFGRMLRSTSLDELPALVNVIRGDMSIVGPRPLLVAYLERYNAKQARRHEVRPGITGLAQVSGRNAISWDERFSLDVEYVDNRSLRLDASIVARTVTTVFKREGISAADSATMTEFLGNDEEPSP
ncbi:sugar transferase [Salinibacterium sp. M195]|uniref:sugar transferase n=1 Tax=Salinibacterium sp. M195 TaxID=2583374 RepID=UPI001C6257A7|nr:sugar transferase [Salinibacterium sp. M195]QYH34842.1 sugar transferase [Salinibacterium sp. M195]